MPAARACRSLRTPMRTAAPIARRFGAAAAAPLLALGLAACGNTVSTSSFKGEQHEVAQRIADLQSHATSSEYDKICGQDIAKALLNPVKSAKPAEPPGLGGKQGCEKA